MDPMKLAGALMIFSAVPGLLIGLMLLTGKWNPASIRAARNPEKARVATARLLVGVDALLIALGVALLVAPREHGELLAIGGVATIVLASTALAIAAVKANQA